jgi:hypothetical protein
VIQNYEFKFKTRGKFIFVPNERGERKGRRIVDFFAKRVKFPEYFYHYQFGGHVAALHAHLKNKLFFKIDIQNFYYSIARERVTRALRGYGYPGAQTLAKWSCVANPIPGSKLKYVLPIGFVQSPLLASLVLWKSPVAAAISRAMKNGVCISVYLDDFVGSHTDEAILATAYDDIRHACASSGLIPNPNKLMPPSAVITVFNCALEQGSALVTPERVAKYYAQMDRVPASDAAFEEYRARVAAANEPWPI